MKFNELLKCCLNYKVLVGAGVILVIGYFVAPQLTRASWPLLLILICPVSMILMMFTMRKHAPEDDTPTS